jgi:polyhydroxybutyrate depolymerase
MFDRWTGFSALADQAGFALAMPSAIDEIWNDGRYDGPAWGQIAEIDDVEYLATVIDDALGRGGLDRRRVYVVGMSNGATMAGRLACERAERLAAVGQVSGTVAVEVAISCQPTVPVPILEIHGTRDAMAPYAGGRARGVRARWLLRQLAGPCLGVDDWARFWVGANGAAVGPQVANVPPDTSIRCWSGQTPASDIAFYRVDRGGHTWPGNRMWVPPLFGRTSRAFDATAAVWDFFARHLRDA